MHVRTIFSTIIRPIDFTLAGSIAEDRGKGSAVSISDVFWVNGSQGKLQVATPEATQATRCERAAGHMTSD